MFSVVFILDRYRQVVAAFVGVMTAPVGILTRSVPADVGVTTIVNIPLRSKRSR